MRTSSEKKQRVMASFEEDVVGGRRMVSMAGRNKETGKKKEDLMKIVREDRERRALEAKREQSAVIIQRNVRGVLSRLKTRREVLQDALRKISDLEKVYRLLATKQPKFAAPAASAKLIRACLFAGDVTNKELARGLLLAVKSSKPNETMDYTDVFRNRGVLSFLLSAPFISSQEIDQLLMDEGPQKFQLSKSSPSAILRASKDRAFANLAKRSLSDLNEEYPQLNLEEKRQLVLAFFVGSSNSVENVKEVLETQSGATKTALFSSISYFLNRESSSPVSSRRRKRLFPAGEIVFDSKREADISMLKNRALHVLAEMVGIQEEKMDFSIESYAECLSLLVNNESSEAKVMAVLCDPKRIGALFRAAKKQSLAATLKLCSLLSSPSLEKNKKNGLSLRSLCELGAITADNAKDAPIIGVWEAILSAAASSTTSINRSSSSSWESVVNSTQIEFASGATSLLLDTVEDNELFLQTPELVRQLENIARFVKQILFDAIWLKKNPEPFELSIGFFTRLNERCSRHFSSGLVSKETFLFPTISPIELGLTSATSMADMTTQFHRITTMNNRRSQQQSSTDGVENEEEDDEGQGMEILTQASPRGQLLLRTLPFAIPFEQRVILFSRHLQKYKQDHEDIPLWNEISQRIEHPNRVQIEVKRDTIVEDAYEQAKSKNLSGRLQVQFVNDLGLAEAGIDGGGLFKEFITTFCREAFDPSFGLFQLSSNNQLYPTPQRDRLALLEFVGKMLGKAVFEGVLVETSLSPFVLNLVRGNKNSVNDLVYLDKDLYRSLMSLKNLKESELMELDLNFTVVTQNGYEVELVPQGRQLRVTKENVALFVERMVDFKLNREFRDQIEAFGRGFNQLIEPNWVRLFSASEMEMLIGGTIKDFDVLEMKKYASYGGGYHPSQPYIQDFWSVVANDLDSTQRGKLLKFITSCSRPPLTGFGSLEPKITVYQVRDDIERLPTASTCVNLLKLPKYPSKEILRNKLILAIESESGFELS